MRDDLSRVKRLKFEGWNGGEGTIEFSFLFGDAFQVYRFVIPPNASIGYHLQQYGDDVNYVLSGKGEAICEGKKEELYAGVIHVCHRGEHHSIANTGTKDLILLSFHVREDELEKRVRSQFLKDKEKEKKDINPFLFM